MQKGAGFDRQNGKVDADSHQRLLAAGKGFQIFDDLARRGYPDADAAGQHIAFVLQHKAGFAAAEQLGEDAAEVFVDGAEAVGEDSPASGGQLCDHASQLVAALLHVGHLTDSSIVAGSHLLVLLDGAYVHAAKGADLAAQVSHLCPQSGQAVELHAQTSSA